MLRSWLTHNKTEYTNRFVNISSITDTRFEDIKYDQVLKKQKLFEMNGISEELQLLTNNFESVLMQHH